MAYPTILAQVAAGNFLALEDPFHAQGQGFHLHFSGHAEWGILREGRDLAEGDLQPEDWDHLVFFDLYATGSKDLAQGLFRQMDALAQDRAGDRADSEALVPYGPYQSDLLPEASLMTLQAQEEAGFSGPSYQFMVLRDQTLLVASYAGPLEIDEFLPYFLNLLDQPQS